MPEPLSPDDPTRVGGYELTGRLGDGGQGSVYLGRDAAGRTVAVKLLHARLGRDPAARARFVRELEVAERVSGFCTARVLDADIDGDRPYIVSEFVDGPSLADLVRRDGPLDAAALTRLAIGTATALAAIHRAGIVHRDFKPPNVLVGPGGPRVIDFGIARALDSEAVTVTSQVVGTPAYMAPEQIAGARVGPAADVFAWGGTMLFAATGRLPFGGDSIPAVLNAVLNAEADVRALPGPLAEVVAACLAKDPARRPSSAEVLNRLLGAVGAQDPGDPQDGDLLERGATLVYSPPADLAFAPSTRPVRPPRRHRRTRVVALSALAAALATALPPTLWALRDTGGQGPGGGTVKTVRVAFIGPLSKGGIDVSPLGKAMRDGAKAAIWAHNRKKPPIRVELVEFDTQGEPTLAEAAARQAVERKVVAVIGPSLTGESHKAVPVLERAGIPNVSPAAANATLVEQGWTTWHAVVPDAKVASAALADLAVTKGRAKKVAVVEDSSAAATTVADYAIAKLGLLGATPERMRTRRGSDHADAVKKIKESGADAVLYGGAYPDAGPLVKRARAAGITARFYLSDGALDKEFISLAGEREAQGTVFTCSCLLTDRQHPTGDKGYGRFFTTYRDVHGSPPPSYAAEGYDAAGVLLSAIAARRDTPHAINMALRTVDYTGGVAPRIRFTDKGEIIDGVAYAYQANGNVINLLGEAGKASIH
ncbi:bifunctional serine/threonine-protein kinase/ABC transporter substrate-binding protein [Actinomadura kijaniata]|uniref:bifunctional serine/threonine-protein kinase/ABC transporter substrate-binding protein n=1 Tax=Actinomadura kijaniata TaxID=46161 RepID=UPI003F1AE734